MLLWDLRLTNRSGTRQLNATNTRRHRELQRNAWDMRYVGIPALFSPSKALTDERGTGPRLGRTKSVTKMAMTLLALLFLSLHLRVWLAVDVGRCSTVTSTWQHREECRDEIEKSGDRTGRSRQPTGLTLSMPTQTRNHVRVWYPLNVCERYDCCVVRRLDDAPKATSGCVMRCSE